VKWNDAKDLLCSNYRQLDLKGCCVYLTLYW